MDGFEPYRDAARGAIAAGGGDPVMAEDWPSQRHSSRTACLDGVASADALFLVLGERGGWTAPSGLLVVEDEFREAERRKLPVYAFVQDGVDRDADAERLAHEVSDYVSGLFRRTFADPASLAAEVERAVASLDPLPTSPMPSGHTDLRALVSDVESARAASRGGLPERKTLRFVLAPERAGEVVDPRKLDDPGFQHDVMSAATSPTHRLLAYGQPVAPRSRGTALVIERVGEEGTWRDARPARIEVHERGLVLVDVPLEVPASQSPGGLANGATIPPHVLDEGRVEGALLASMQFAGAVYDLVDPYRRFDRFQMDVALSGVEGSVLERSPQPRSSYTVPWRQVEPGPLTPLAEPRLVNRHDLANPDDEVDRLITYLRRALTA